ncbi:MAG: helix-turn-helix domain-containing protein [Clostridia bacterium]|nr:helix-turn-helix domain-containing protein [Clostridia bacterium]
MEIGAKIKQLRNKAGLTQEQLASALGISAQSVSKWENAVTMPDVALLPLLAGELGVSIDELFDLTVEQKLHRIERGIDVLTEFTPEVFKEYEEFLLHQLDEHPDRTLILEHLSRLYHFRMEADAKRVSKYAREAMLRAPEKKVCQWMLQKSEGADVWDWNVANHSRVIDFYKQVIASDKGTPKATLPYMYLIDNLIADHRTTEAAQYLDIYATLPAARPFIIPVYRAHIALAEFDKTRADSIMAEAEQYLGNDPGFLFELAQYHAQTGNYQRAITYYEASWENDTKKPRYTDALDAICIIYEILGDKENAIAAYDRLLTCLTEEWGYCKDDAVVMDAQRRKNQVLQA